MPLSGPEFVSPQDLAKFLRMDLDTDNDALMDQMYEAIESGMDAVMSVIGVDTLEERQVVETVKIRVPCHVLVLDSGPITELNSVTISGEVWTDVVARHWSLKSYRPFPAMTAIELDYVVGYRVNSDGSQTMPSRINRAIKIAAGDFYQSPNTRMKRERIGDYEYEKDKGGAEEGKTSAFESLLREYVRV